MDQTAPQPMTLWRNRFYDRRSLRAFAILIFTIVLGSIVLTSLTGPTQPSADAPLPLYLVLVEVAVAMYFLKLLLSLLLLSVPFGHKALIKFFGHFTNEVASSGRLILPFGYARELVDCRPIPIPVDEQDVLTKNGSTIKASISARVRVTDCLKFIELEVDRTSVPSFLAPFLQAELRAAFTNASAPRAFSDPDALNAAAMASFNKKLSDWNYGLFCDRVLIDVLEAPAHLFQQGDERIVGKDEFSEFTNLMTRLPEMAEAASAAKAKILKAAEGRELTNSEKDLIATIDNSLVTLANIKAGQAAL